MTGPGNRRAKRLRDDGSTAVVAGLAERLPMAKRRKPGRGAVGPTRTAAGSPGPAAASAVRTPPPSGGRPDAGALAAAVLGPLALYAATLPRTVVLEDDGLFLMAGVHLGVAHPPGYPLYTLIVHLFTRLPFGDPAVLGHLSSAVLGALACGAVYCCARLLRASPPPALAAAWLFGVSEQFWSQAIVSEVYTLNALLFFAAYALVLLGARGPRRGWPLWCAAVAWGAGLANHWPLMVLATPGLALALLPVWRDVLPRLPRLLAAALAAALLPYAWMVWLSHQAPLISFYGPIDTWSELWFFVSRAGYSGVDVSPSAGWGDRWAFAGWLAADLVRQTTVPGFALALFGLAALARRGGRAGAAAVGAGVLALLGNSLVLIVLLGFDFDEFRLALFRPYPLICYGVVALWVAAGLDALAGRLPGWAVAWRPAGGAGTRPALPSARAPAALAALAGAVLVVASASANWRANDRSDSDFAAWYAEAMFDPLPPDAALFVHGDASGPLGYYRYVAERRPDIALYNLHGLVFGNRLYDPLLPPEEKARMLDRFVGSTDRPVFLDLDADILPGERVRRYYGFVMEVLDDEEDGTIQLHRHPRDEQYFLDLLDRQPTDRWERVRRNALLSHYATHMGLVLLSGAPVLLDPIEPLFPRADDCYPCLTGMSAALLDNWDEGASVHAGRVAAWLARAEALRGQALTKGESADLPYLRGLLAELTGDGASAAAGYRRSYAIYPHPRSEAAAALRRLGLVP